MDATFMTALHIAHVRHLKDIHIPLSAEKTTALILTGKNGSGKTSVLESIKHFLEYVVSPNFYTKEQCQTYIENDKKRISRLSETDDERIKSESFKNTLANWERYLSYWTDGTIVDFTSYADLRTKYKAGNYILAYYKDKREVRVETSKNIEKIELKPVYSLSDHPSHQLVKYLVNLKTTEAFARTNNNPKRAEEIANWFTRFEKILRSIYEDDSLTLNFDIETFQFTISTKGREAFDFNAMSMGYAAVFDIISDLIMRMESQRRYDLEGIVLIDEIETHLHVELQKKIVPILMALFPNLQFVLTTHSPFILNSTPNAVVYDLENKTLVENGLTNLPYDGIVEGYFGVDLLSQELREKFEAYKSLATKVDLKDEDFAKAAELELYLDEVPDYLAVDFSAEYSRLKLELSKRGERIG